jgi:hypothetical protein
LYNSTWADGRPRFAVWLTNTSTLTLDGGAFTVIDTNSFAGEGLLETIQPNERRLLSYAVDLAAEINTDRESEQRRVERIVINRGLLVLHRKVVDKRTYIIRNRSEQRQTFLIEHPVRPGWTLTDTPDPVESSSESYRFQVRVDGGSTERFRVSEQMPQESQYQVANVTPDQVAIWVRERSLDAETERALRVIVNKKNEIAEVTQQLNLLRSEQDSIFQDQSRVRENLNRLGRTPEEAQLRQRYIQQMESQEDRLAQLRSEQERLQGTLDQAQRELGEMVDRLSLDRRTG